MLQFRDVMRIVKSMEAVGPLSKPSPPWALVWLCFTFMLLTFRAGRFLALIGGIFLLYEPIKTLSRMHIVDATFQLQPPSEFLEILDSHPPFRILPTRNSFDTSKGSLEFRECHVSVTRGGIERCG